MVGWLLLASLPDTCPVSSQSSVLVIEHCYSDNFQFAGTIRDKHREIGKDADYRFIYLITSKLLNKMRVLPLSCPSPSLPPPGNAVPPPLGRALGLEIRKAILQNLEAGDV